MILLGREHHVRRSIVMMKKPAVSCQGQVIYFTPLLMNGVEWVGGTLDLLFQLLEQTQNT